MKINSSRRLHLMNAQLFTYVASAYVYMQWMVAEEDWLQTLYCQTNKSFSPNACMIFFFVCQFFISRCCMEAHQKYDFIKGILFRKNWAVYV